MNQQITVTVNGKPSLAVAAVCLAITALSRMKNGIKVVLK